MPKPEDGFETVDDPPERDLTVQPLERTAPIYVETRSGYVDIRQVQGDPTLYTPEEARDIAREVLAAADACERVSDAQDAET